MPAQQIDSTAIVCLGIEGQPIGAYDDFTVWSRKALEAIAINPPDVVKRVWIEEIGDVARLMAEVRVSL